VAITHDSKTLNVAISHANSNRNKPIKQAVCDRGYVGAKVVLGVNIILHQNHPIFPTIQINKTVFYPTPQKTLGVLQKISPVVLQFKRNPYYQYFCGHSNYIPGMPSF
jgi:hypothetical protein